MATQTYDPIASIILGTDAATVTFSNIPQTYTDLVLITNAKLVSSVSNLVGYFNADTGSNYSYTQLGGNGTSALSARGSSTTRFRFDYQGYLDTTINEINITHIMNYANTTTNKTCISRGNNAATGADVVVNLWRSTAAISSITFTTNGGNYATGSTFNLFGIKAGNA